MKVCEKCGDEIYTRDGENRCTRCDNGKKPKRTSPTRKERDQLMKDLGLVKVRGAMGGTYYE